MSAKSLDEMLHWALTHGIGMGIKPAPGQEAASRLIITHAPFTVGAFPFPRSQFEKAVHIAPLFNVMVEKVSRNPQWLIDTLRPTACTDDFVRRLLDLYEIVLREGVKQTISLGLIRSDYMVHKKPGDSRSLLQVEINTIASSFGSLSTKIAEMHRTFAAMEGDYSRAPPENNAVTGLAEGIAAGHKAFIAQTRIDNCSCIMVVQPNERNFCDQRLLQFELFEKFQVPCLRLTLAEIYEQGKLRDDGVLDIQGKAISVVYFRSGYSPEDHPTEKEWESRLLIERSLAIKCPSIAYHLAGCKKIQEALAEPGVLEQFISNKEHATLLRSVFAGLYNLSPDQQASAASVLSLAEITKMVEADGGAGFVLKPQREGGGHNFYGADVLNALHTMTPEDLAAYTLMERILPPSHDAKLVRNGEVIDASCLCELGVYGIILCDSSSNFDIDGAGSSSSSSAYVNKYVGYLLRVKPAMTDEGGVAAGYAVLSSPLLQDSV